ncbi:hypothetical protein ACFXI3_14845 [Amycolatopsis sp. NPDC059235]|uniref:hypothetical protein n=1 Tax=Amycolatopsis sp. NPDC059235 TaxID=3346782 RepID=UPI00366C333B
MTHVFADRLGKVAFEHPGALDHSQQGAQLFMTGMESAAQFRSAFHGGGVPGEPRALAGRGQIWTDGVLDCAAARLLFDVRSAFGERRLLRARQRDLSPCDFAV